MLHNKTIIIILFGLICFTSKAQKEIKSFKINISEKLAKSEIRNTVLYQLNKYYADTLNSKEITGIEYLGKYNLENSGKNDIYRISLSYDLPMVWHYSIVLIVDEHNNGYFIELDSVELIKIRKSHNTYYFAGRYKDRNQYGVFKIYKFKNNKVTQVFESNYPVSNYSLDCESYEHGDLKLRNIDINNDGYLGLKFSGIKNYYCNGLEQVGRDERTPIKQEKITINYVYDPIINKWKNKRIIQKQYLTKQ
ncbi:MAG: hypothetical protein Q8904_00665 [Bacteroidota bacterium]|nr:hypothetical protein [Bacteroidota bacterium]